LFACFVPRSAMTKRPLRYADFKKMCNFSSLMLTNQLIKTGRLLYGIGIAALGIHQLITKTFRPEILPPFPTWTHKYIALPILTGIALLLAGVIISGLLKTKLVNAKTICLYLGFSFLVLIIACHLPYILIYNSDRLSRIEVWFGAGEALAYSGGAFVMAGSFTGERYRGGKKNSFEVLLEKLIPVGRIFYSLLIILFGSTHFVFTDIVSAMIPKWFGPLLFWTYFAGTALIASGIAIIFRIWIRPVAFLLAIMLFLFFIFFHVPDAIANPSSGGGNEIVRATIALLFCGIALVLAMTNGSGNKLLRLV
jgi:uncharacterized membrane protein YphA (DoxX/SURF4 family)